MNQMLSSLHGLYPSETSFTKLALMTKDEAKTAGDAAIAAAKERDQEDVGESSKEVNS